MRALKTQILTCVTFIFLFASYCSVNRRHFTNEKQYLEKKVKENLKFKTVILLAQPRSGSNLLGQILSLGSNNFYSVEPIYFTLQKALQKDNGSLINKRAILKDVIHCSFGKYYKDFRALLIKSFTPMTVDTCLIFPKLCETVEIEAKIEEMFCRISDLHVVKTIKASLNDTVDILSNKIDETFKSTAIVHLVRDPRAVLSSRNVYLKVTNVSDYNSFITFLDSNTPQEVCKIAIEDLRVAQQYKNIFENRFVKESSTLHSLIPIIK